MTRILIIGCGGHGKVVADILQQQGAQVYGFLDDDPATWGHTRLGVPVLGSLATLSLHAPDGVVLGIGLNRIRQQVVERLGAQAGSLWYNAIHPRAIVAPSARLGRGVVVAASAVINPDAVVGDHAIVNTGASVDHDCVVESYAHVAPGAHLAGGVSVATGALVGAGATVAPARSVGAWATVGVGAAVVHNVPAGVVAKGVPARWSPIRAAVDTG